MALLAFAILLLITGVHMRHGYHSALATCHLTQSCDSLSNDLFSGKWYGLLSMLIALTLIVPGLIGVFWGAPLVARDFEDGTHKLAWTQSVTRRRWMIARVAWALLFAIVWGAAISALVTWWSGTENSLQSFRFQNGHFDVQGVIPLAYNAQSVVAGSG